MTRIRYRAAALLLALAAAGAPHQVASAQSAPTALVVAGLTQSDEDGDGRPDLTVIDAAFATAHDRIMVVDQARTMVYGATWQQATDFEDDIWIYDIGADGDAQLIVVYTTEGERHHAYVYADVDGDGAVSYRRGGTSVSIDETPYWSARISAEGPWVLPNGRLNLNLRIAVDGQVRTLDRAPPLDDWLKHDGKADVEAESHAGANGIATYVLIRLMAETPQSWGFQRSSLFVNEGQFPTQRPEQAFFPLLPIPPDVRDPRFINLRYFDIPLILSIDWRRGAINGPQLPGYPIGHGYHYNNDRYITKGEVNDVAFESPHAYYDLAQNHDAFPELHIRFFTRPPFDQAMWTLPGREAVPWQSISYSWNLFNPGTMRWDYKLGLGGNYDIDEVTEFPDFALRQVPFAHLPSWIMERPWKLTTFMAREGEGYESSEGLYEWQTDTGVDPESGDGSSEITREATQSYMQGLTAEPPDALYRRVRVGFRAERHFASPLLPRLYFSPVDHRLHLRGAEAGIWNIDGSNVIQYSDLDRDGYLDQWIYQTQGRTRRQLVVFRDYLLYSDGASIALKQVSVQPSLFEAPPPRSHAEWSAQRERLAALHEGHRADDLEAMFAQFAGPVWRLERARLQSARPDGTGFRFVAEVEPGARATGDGAIQIPRLGPGRHVISFAGAFHAAPLTPPAVAASLHAEPSVPLQMAPITVQLRNDGREDVISATLDLWATSPSGNEQLVATRRVDLLANTAVTATLTWAPAEAGTWTFSPRITDAHGGQISLPPVAVDVLPGSAPPPLQIATASIGWQSAGMALLVLLGLAALGAATVWEQWRPAP
ncbi:MAG: hypothetical protein DIU80_000640 [Chloroflexota bacterium]